MYFNFFLKFDRSHRASGLTLGKLKTLGWGPLDNFALTDFSIAIFRCDLFCHVDHHVHFREGLYGNGRGVRWGGKKQNEDKTKNPQKTAPFWAQIASM